MAKAPLSWDPLQELLSRLFKSFYFTSYPNIYTMVVVAIAGGTGSVGRSLVDAFIEDGKHEVIVLARAVSSCVVGYHDIDLHADQ